MSQESIYEYLKERKGEKYTSEEIRNALGLSISAVMVSVLKLYRYGEIEREATTLYRSKTKHMTYKYWVKK